MAIKAAKEKADYLLGAIGEETGKPLVVREQHANRSSAYRYDDGAGLNVKGPRETATDYYIDGIKVDGAKQSIEFEKITYRISMYVKFAIK